MATSQTTGDADRYELQVDEGVAEEAQCLPDAMRGGR
jgi:hypothetical protein